MSFGGFGGFGSNNNQSSGFGSSGFGANNNNTTGGFGSTPAAGTGFGSTGTPGGGLFGGSGSNTGTGFGGFGAQNNNTTSPFGAKPAFGAAASSGGGLFGSNTATAGSGFGGFGAANNTTTNTASTGFGANNSGGLFGANKPAFGSGTGTTGGGLFGGGSSAGGFGANAGTTTTGSAFGAPTATAFGQNAQNTGTGSTPFQAFQEKEGTAGNGQAAYQTITFMAPYSGFSLEELRLADYAQGRKFGNTNGQAGAFGTSTGFGGFGASTTNTGFGANNTTNTSSGGLFGGSGTTGTGTGFGAQTQTPSTGFGGSSGGLFGQKPATGGLFGSTPAATSGTQTGGLFGTTGASTGGFGTNTGSSFGTNNNTTGGLFGANNTQNKPAFGGFGTANTGTTGTSAFGGTAGGFGTNASTTTTGGGLFGGANTGTSAFGANNNQQQSTTGGGLFGGGGFGQNNQNQTQQQSGGLFGGFGQNNAQTQQKPALFGNTGTTTTGGGLFGNTNANSTQTQQTGGGLFGNTNNNQQQSGGLFGAKPATTGGGLFGNTNNQQTTGTTGGGLFGGLGANQNQQQTTGGGLFGTQNNQQQNKPLFGASTTTANTGGGLFGGLGQNNNNTSTSQPLGGSLFGASQNNQQQPQNNSLFGSQQSQQSPLTTSLQANPYGNDQLFASLSTPSQSVGPLATPLSSTQKARKNAILPQHKINPAASTRLITPQKRGLTYGFSYSTYGTPGSASSGTLVSSSFGRSLGKSFSGTNLRQSWSAEDSILAPNAFSSTATRGYQSGSLKRLTIDRSLNTPPSRPSLFSHANGNESSTASASKKSVSFEPNSSGTSERTPTQNGALVRVESSDGTPNGNDAHATPNGDSARGKELAVVQEERSPNNESKQASSERQRAKMLQLDQEPGSYYTSPSIEELKKMSPQELKHVKSFTVGREGVGSIEFVGVDGTVDLSNTPLDQICGGIVELNIRNATAYGNKCPVPKPPRGKDLNVPSIIRLENSWPRSSGGALPVHERKGPRYEKHVQRLKRVTDTEFIDYDATSGVWTFKVEHYTTYGLDYEGESDEGDSTMLAAAPDSPSPQQRTPGSRRSDYTRDTIAVDESDESGPDDTFDFKKGKRSQVPGQFSDDESMYVDEEQYETTQQSFLGERSVGSPVENGQDEVMSNGSESVSVEEHEMAGSFPQPDPTTELSAASQGFVDGNFEPKSILKQSTNLLSFESPSKPGLMLGDDWAEQLQRTISPKKKDRNFLRQSQAQFDRKQREPPESPSFNKTKGFATSIQLMQSLFGENPAATGSVTKQTAGNKAFEWPYATRANNDGSNMTHEQIIAGHRNFKPKFAYDGTLVHAASGDTPKLKDGILVDLKGCLASEHNDVRFATFVTPKDAESALKPLREFAVIRQADDGVPESQIGNDFEFSNFSESVSLTTSDGVNEHHIWQLASILFDSLDRNLPDDLSFEQYKDHEQRYRKEKLAQFWQGLVQDEATAHAQNAKSLEEKALAHLSGHNIVEACAALVEAKDVRLATLIAQINANETLRQEMAAQLESWSNLNVLSEMSEPIRAMYELLAGNCSECEGRNDLGPENKLTSFKMASRFGLSWRRAFGLRLWYGTLEEEDIAMAVAQYADDLRDGREDVLPLPFVRAEWDDPEPKSREDILWGLLKIYAAQQMDVHVNVEDVLHPASVSGNPLDARLSWQILQTLIARGIDLCTSRTLPGEDSFISSGSSFNAKADQAEDAVQELSDSLTLTLASSLHTEKDFVTALFVYTYLRDADLRQKYLKELLAHYAASYEVTDASDPLYRELTHRLRIPSAWLHEAKALYARSVLGDRVLEVEHLCEAGLWSEAHSVLCRAVAPEAVIARDYERLKDVLRAFEKAMQSSTGSSRNADAQDVVAGWAVGGQVYSDYLHLLELETKSGDEAKEKLPNIVGRLSKSLEAMAGEMDARDLEERVAIMEIADKVAKWVANGVMGPGQVLKLPMTSDAYLRHSVNLGIHYFRGILAGGR